MSVGHTTRFCTPGGVLVTDYGNASAARRLLRLVIRPAAIADAVTTAPINTTAIRPTRSVRREPITG